MIRLFSIEDHWLVIDGLKTKFRQSRDEIAITCSAATIGAALEGNNDDLFDIILLDLFLPGTDPLDNIRRLMARYPNKPVVILTAEDQEIWKMQVAEVGVMAYLTKHAKKEEISNTLKRVYRGENILNGLPEQSSNPRSGQEKDRYVFGIKPSERQLLCLLANGLSQKQIAGELFITESAIEKTLKKLRKQFSVNSTLELVRTLEKYHFFPPSGQTPAGK